MKTLARSFVWWPGLDRDIEERVRSWSKCTDAQLAPKVVPLLLWPWAKEPWQIIHVDYAEVRSQNFLVVVDSYSKWLDTLPTSSTTAVGLITVLRSLLARYGLATQLVFDNGPQFVAD